MKSSKKLSQVILDLGLAHKIPKSVDVNKLLKEADFDLIPLNSNNNNALQEAVIQSNFIAVSYCLSRIDFVPANASTFEKLAKKIDGQEDYIFCINSNYDSALTLAVQYKDTQTSDAKHANDKKEEAEIQDRRACLNLLLNHNPKAKRNIVGGLKQRAEDDYRAAVLRAAEHECIYYLDWFFKNIYSNPKERANKLKDLFAKNTGKYFWEHPFLKSKFLSLDFVVSLIDETSGPELLDVVMPIHQCALSGDEVALEVFLKYQNKAFFSRRDVNIHSASNKTALTHALIYYAKNKNEKDKTKRMIDKLLAAGATWSGVDIKLAIEEEDPDLTLFKLLSEYNALQTDKCEYFSVTDINDRTKITWWGAAEYATGLGKIKSLDYLLTQDILQREWKSLNHTLDIKVNGCLIQSVCFGQMKVTKDLLARSVDQLVQSPQALEKLIEKVKKRKDYVPNQINSLELYLKALHAYLTNNKKVFTECLDALQKNIVADHEDILNLLSKIEVEKQKQQLLLDAKANPILELIKLKAAEGAKEVPQVNAIIPSAPSSANSGAKDSKTSVTQCVSTLYAVPSVTEVHQQIQNLKMQLQLAQTRNGGDMFSTNEALRQSIIDHAFQQLKTLSGIFSANTQIIQAIGEVLAESRDRSDTLLASLTANTVAPA